MNNTCEAQKNAQIFKENICPMGFILIGMQESLSGEKKETAEYKGKVNGYIYLLDNFAHHFCRCEKCISFLKSHDLFDESKQKDAPTDCPGKFAEMLLSNIHLLYGDDQDSVSEWLSFQTVFIGTYLLSTHYCHCNRCVKFCTSCRILSNPFDYQKKEF